MRFDKKIDFNVEFKRAKNIIYKFIPMISYLTKKIYKLI